MKLHAVFARFYKSFNFDHLRKAHPDAKPYPWDMYGDQFFPYVQVALEPEITTIVGANESGKSHLLSAIERAITGADFAQRDLCRYSPFFNVELGKVCWPHLGLEWSALTADESDQLAIEIGGAGRRVDRFLMFREGPELLRIFIPTGQTYSKHELTGKSAARFGTGWLPPPFRIKADVGLPTSVPLQFLIDPSIENSRLASRREKANLIGAGRALKKYWREDMDQFAKSASSLYSAADQYLGTKAVVDDLPEKHFESLTLARDLLLKLAHLDPNRLSELSDAIIEGDEGHANALMQRINEQLALRLNFQKWWIQDRDFSLQVTSRETDLVFTIRDRTGTEYTFSERSSGLRYYLSYLIQSQVHTSPGRPEILLMDEPDAYLSAEAQQDLLKIFENFAHPEDETPPVQVVYVTHSPFLLDKNHAERIRVLQKGRGFDGTRVIRNAAQNHYEPLRSAFGAFVGETAFIGACNLMVEGAADQIILSGVARITRRLSPALENDTLDLNRLVIVPCGSASQVPYMVYLARGRDADRPPVLALLDSDKAGNEAARQLREDRRLRRLISSDLVLRLAELGLLDDEGPGRVEIEDLVPPALAVAAANACLQEIARFRDQPPPLLTIADFDTRRTSEVSTFAALAGAAETHGFHIEKIAFARALIHLCGQQEHPEELRQGIATFIDRMRLLFRKINVARRIAEKEALRTRVGTLVDRQQVLFVRDHPDRATREQGANLLHQIEGVLEDSPEGDEVKAALVAIRRDFNLDEDLAALVANYDAFKLRLSVLKDSFDLNRTEINDRPLQNRTASKQKAVPKSKAITVKRRPKGKGTSARTPRKAKARETALNTTEGS